MSRQESLLGEGGSDVTYGSLAAIPIDNGLVWVRPFYVTSTQTDLPSLRFVIVNFEGTVSIKPTLIEALADVFDQDLPTEEEPPPDPGEEPEPEPEGTIDEQVAVLLTEASDLFDQADQALRDGDLAGFEEAQRRGSRSGGTGRGADRRVARHRGADHHEHHRADLDLATSSLAAQGRGGPPRRCAPSRSIDGGVERVAEVDDRPRAIGGRGLPLPAVLGDDRRHPHGQVVDAGPRAPRAPVVSSADTRAEW